VNGNIIELADLTKKYGSFTAVDSLNLNIRKGEIFGLLGPNGAGKSTTILMMLGLTEPSSGMVRVCGLDPNRNPIEVKRKVGYLPEDVGFYDNRTGLENLIFTAQLNSIPQKESIEKSEQLLIKVGLKEALHKRTGKYSRGMLQRLGLADALIKDPEVIILDEPTLGIDPKGVREFLDLIVTLSHEEGITVLFSSHDLHQVQKVCDKVGLFVNGKLLAEGDIQSLSRKIFNKNPFLIEAEVVYSRHATDHEEINNRSINLAESIKKLEGVVNITISDRKYLIECSKDESANIARIIVDSDAELNSLSKKEYGLDEIYYRYFEGGELHEKAMN
jgi:ABC-2 type transport system ATP-binding protein